MAVSLEVLAAVGTSPTSVQPLKGIQLTYEDPDEDAKVLKQTQTVL